MSVPKPSALAARKPASVPASAVPPARTRTRGGTFTTSTPVPPMRRAAGDGYGFTTDPTRQRASTDAERNARRLEQLFADRDKFGRLCDLHYGKNQAAWSKAWSQLDHVDMLIHKGRVEGRWE